jgi:hypothetical protein
VSPGRGRISTLLLERGRSPSAARGQAGAVEKTGRLRARQPAANRDGSRSGGGTVNIRPLEDAPALDEHSLKAQTGRMRTHHLSAALFVLAFAMFGIGANPPRQITVFAGDYNRQGSIVCFAVPADRGQPQELKDKRGELIAVQADKEGRGWFIEKCLNRGPRRVISSLRMKRIPVRARACTLRGKTAG